MLQWLLPIGGLAMLAGPAFAQSLLHLQVVVDGDLLNGSTVDGLNFIEASAVSPDGKHVYTVGGVGTASGDDDNAIAAFARGNDGLVSFVEAEFDDQDGGTADGLSSARDVVLSPDGNHVYTAASSEAEIGIFSRNASTGALTYLGVVQEGGALQGLSGVTSLAMTPDGSALFTVGSADDALLAFSRNTSNGLLTLEDGKSQGGGTPGIDRPLSVAVSPDGLHVYTAAGGNRNFTGSDAVAAFSWNGGTGTLTHIASYFEGQVQGINTIDGLHDACGVVVSPDGNHVYVTGGIRFNSPDDSDWIAIFSRNAATGVLTWIDSIDSGTICDFQVTGEFCTWAVVAPDNRRVFVTHHESALVGFLRDPVTGLLTQGDADCFFDSITVSDLVGNGLNLPGKISIDPSGKHIYATGTASDALSVFGPEPPRIEIVDLDGNEIDLRVTNLSAGLPSRIEWGPDMSGWPNNHTFTPTDTTFDWSTSILGQVKQYFRAGFD